MDDLLWDLIDQRLVCTDMAMFFCYLSNIRENAVSQGNKYNIHVLLLVTSKAKCMALYTCIWSTAVVQVRLSGLISWKWSDYPLALLVNLSHCIACFRSPISALQNKRAGVWLEEQPSLGCGTASGCHNIDLTPAAARSRNKISYFKWGENVDNMLVDRPPHIAKKKTYSSL